MAGPLELQRAIDSRKPIRAAAAGLDGIEIDDFTGEQYMKACWISK